MSPFTLDQSHTASTRTAPDKDPSRFLQAVHAECTGILATPLNDILGTVTVSLISLEETTPEALRVSHGEPGVSIVFAGPRPQACILECSKSLAMLAVEHALGSDGVGNPVHRSLSEIELQLVRGAFDPLLAAYGKLWSRYVVFQPKFYGFNSVYRPAEPLYVATYRASTALGSGELRFVLRLHAWAQALSAIVQPVVPDPATESNAMLGAIGECSIVVRALLGRTRITVQELLDLHVGDIICLERKPSDPVEVRIGDQPKLLGSVHVEHEQFVIAVEGNIPRETR